MADQVTFRAALNRCGIVNNATTQAITGEGYVSMLTFARMSEKGVAEFVKTMNKILSSATPPIATIPLASVELLQAMRLWTLERMRLGQAVVHADCTAAELVRMVARLDEEARLLVNKPDAPPLPDKFTSFGPKWRVFADGFKSHCAAVRGCMNIPLSYVIREHEAPTQEMFAAQYTETDDRYVALFLLAGGEYQQDNHRVWDLLSPLVRGTAAWEYIKTLEPTKNGRRAFKTLMLRGEGEAALDARRIAAEMTIRKAQYTGKSKRFTLNQYINVLQSAFNDLEAVGEPYSEKRKVDKFVSGLIPDRFAPTRHSVLKDAATRNDFQAAYAFVETMEGYEAVSEQGYTFDRLIGATGTTPGNNNGDSKKNNEWRSNDDWYKLPPEERKRIQAARDKNKKNRNNKNKKKGDEKKAKQAEQANKRKLAEVITEIVKDISLDDSDGEKKPKAKESKTSFAEGSGPQDQFGRNVHAVAKALQKVADGKAAAKEHDKKE